MKKIKIITFLVVLFSISFSLVYLADRFTAPVIEENYLREEYRNLIDAGLVFETIEKMNSDHLVDGISGVYRGKNQNGDLYLAFDASDQNPYALMKMIIVVDEATERIANIHILNDDSHNYKDYFPDYNFGVINTPANEIENNFVLVSHATISSTSVKNCLLQVNQQLEIMGGKIVFQSIKQQLPNYTNFEYTFTKDGQEVTLLLEYIAGNKSFNFLDVITGDSLSEEEILMYLNVAKINLPKNWIRNISVEADGTKITIVTDQGFKGEIVADIKINNRKIVSFDLKTYNESYNKNPHYEFNGDLEDYLFNQYQLGIKGEIVTGATITSNAFNYILALADDYIESLDRGK